MRRLIHGVPVGALALMLVLGAGNVACKKGSSSASTIVACDNGTAGTSTGVFSASGGDADPVDGTGGDGGIIHVAIYYGGAGSIEVKSTGSVDASFTPTDSFTPELGANPLVVTSDLSIPVVTSAPVLGSPYTLEGDSNLYVSDGDMDLGDETPVTGLQVQAGATLTLGLNIGDYVFSNLYTGGLAFSDDIVNEGTITVVDRDIEWRGNIELFAGGDYIGTGRIETFGTIPGQYGGNIDVGALGNGYNSGEWLSYGADQTDDRGGSGGGIYFYTGRYDYAYDDVGEPGGLIENTGNMISNGGSASGATGLGGSAGEIAILPYGSLLNSGDLEAIGGDGVTDGGSGGIIQIAGYYRGALCNTGDLTSDGGDSVGPYRGDGGEIVLSAAGGELRSSGVMLARGGDWSGDDDPFGESDCCGLGGFIGFYTQSSIDDYEESELDVPAGDIWVSGGAIANGGDALASDGSAGAGGGIELSILNDVSKGTQAIHVLGIQGLHAEGGDGGLDGGDAYSSAIELDLASASGRATGSVNVEPLMSSSGGDANPGVMGSRGGDAGDIALHGGTVSYGAATADGGAGETLGADGTITP